MPTNPHEHTCPCCGEIRACACPCDTQTWLPCEPCAEQWLLIGFEESEYDRSTR